MFVVQLRIAEQWLARQGFDEEAMPNMTVIMFWTTNDLSNRKRMLPGLRDRVRTFAERIAPLRRVFVILGGPADLWDAIAIIIF
jgi:hypothetical protein